MSATILATLFRPWAAEKNDALSADAKSCVVESSLSTPLHQDCTVSTTTLTPHPERDAAIATTHPRRPSEQPTTSPSICDRPALKPDEKLSRKSSKPQGKRHKRQTTWSEQDNDHHLQTSLKSNFVNSSALNTHTQSLAHNYWAPLNSAVVGSGVPSAFHPQVPINKSSDCLSVTPHHVLDNAHLLEHLPMGCPGADVGYMSGFCCPDVSADVLTSELALESALLRGVMPSVAQVEEYARLLQIQEQSLKGAHRKQRPKKYRCPHCQVAFSNNGQLKGHVRIHTGERPYKCDTASCGKTFTRNEELTRHKRIHSGLRPYACASCGKRFGRKDHLKKHARTHQPQYHRQLMVPLLHPMPHPFPYIYGL